MKSRMGTFLWLTSCSVVLSAALGLLVFILAPNTWAVSVYLWPGTYVAALLTRIIPNNLIYWLVPEGGPPAFLLLVLLGSFVSWAALLGLALPAVHLMVRRRPNKGAQRIAENTRSR